MNESARNGSARLLIGDSNRNAVRTPREKQHPRNERAKNDGQMAHGVRMWANAKTTDCREP